MAYTVQSPALAGFQPIALTDTVQNHPLGTIVTATDPTFGAGEFIYLKGVGSTVVGSLVVFNPNTGTTTLAPNTANLGQPVAVAMSANVASQYGWYQISGTAVVKKTAVAIAPDQRVWLSGTAGSVFSTVASGKQVLGARTVNSATVVSATGTIRVLIQRPHAQGQTV